MSYSYQANTPQKNLGTIFIILGIVPLAAGVIRFIAGFIDFNGLIINGLESIALIVLWILTITNIKKLKLQFNNPEFNAFYRMIATGGSIFIGAELLYWFGFFFIPIGDLWLYTLTAYDVFLSISLIFLVLAWLRLGEYAITMPMVFRTNIGSGSKLLVAGAATQIIPLLMDIIGAFTITDYGIFVIYVLIMGVIRLGGLVLDLIGYIKIGNQLKMVSPYRGSTEPIVGGQQYTISQPTYSNPQPPVPQSSDAKIKFCIKCGSNLIPDGQFCPKCGWKVEL